ncbi:hypothetical protein P175DRAFT_0467989 [Aspergillus ochraceoroseus IBT 24754]|uniref:BTB domain-containing protein n=2 Tax=Aspergillus ochraceoroseus TaxID=138278 RepID=A0A2T5LKS4_9EURO|nr:uncharacterized protein P175DRAFT_0561373 [Aspergillus ochraceoroseus IBT 24754]XP_040748282.1 uncharacterized protein P175DRAFT_0467989 [Aspergillus ochraceoroseus IBT 24754]KKK14612.1 hypothetical protein AOCH_005804 [Aspergillus ochraceoroseus]PTU16809.1 hypothetical protein P175DRAFT_0561373 [Aspergillus ochraceoroseus IBT 24754]PTU16865.1 hypothetical protein P175DRAFT_0467989 [Aspergillus ochraceoroseus IBT 24754]
MPTKSPISVLPSEMVSQAQVLDRSMPAQGAPSTVSRHSQTSRRHRSSRSHHGGPVHQPQNDFPIFTHTGDVEIVIRAGGRENRYLLHRLILTQCSGFFEASTREEWPQQPLSSRPSNNLDSTALSRISGDTSSLSNGSTLAQSEVGAAQSSSEKKRWRYELDWENKAEDEEPILVQKPPSASGTIVSDFGPYAPSMTKPSSTHTGFARSMANLAGMQSVMNLPHRPSAVAAAANTGTANGAAMDPTLRDYDNLFRLFYNHPPIINNINIATAYAECKALLALADMYDALPVTGPRVDHHLLGFGSRLFKQIAKYPPSYLKLGYLARSRVIFSEALIHVVGQWPAGLPHLRNGPYSPLPHAVLDIVEDKVEDFEDIKARIDSKLLRLTLTTSRGERVTPHNAYLDWLAVSLFRQWLVDSTTPPPSSILKNNSHSIHNNNSSNHSSRGPAASTPTTPSAPRPTDLLPSSATPTPVSSARVYRLIGSTSTQAYLPHEELKKFLKVHPTPSAESLYTREVLKRFERKMDEIKRLAREIVKPLMRNFLELDLKAGEFNDSIPYLTCIKVEDEDIPWE